MTCDVHVRYFVPTLFQASPVHVLGYMYGLIRFNGKQHDKSLSGASSVPKKPQGEKLKRETRDGESIKSQERLRVESLRSYTFQLGSNLFYARGLEQQRVLLSLPVGIFQRTSSVDLLRPTQSKVEQHFFILPRRYRILNINTTTEAPKPAIDSNRTVFVGIN